MRLTSATFIGLCSLSLFAACRDSSNKNVDGSTDTGGGTRIQDVQNDSMAPGTAVELHGVVITAIDTFGAKTGNVWVEEPDGGPFSGVLIFGLPVTQVTPLAVGDIVDLTNTTKDEFAIMGDNSGRTVTELDARMGTISKSGTGTVPAAVSVDALAIGQKATQAERDMEWEKWEGVLIKVDNVTAFQNPACITSAGMCPDKTFESFSATGVMKLESGIANFPKDTSPMMLDTIKSGDCLASVTGIGDYAFDYLIQTLTITTGGTACAPREAGMPNNLCGDGMDNDGNGFSDCMDLGCEVGALRDPACSATGSVVDVQTGAKTGAVQLNNVVITAREASSTGIGKNLWVADSATAAVNNGVQVFFGGATIDPTWTVGATVNLQGLVQEFDTGNPQMGDKLTEFTSPTVTLVSAGPATLTPLAATAAQVGDITNSETYEGVLVKLTNVKVTAVGMHNQVTLTDNAGGTVTMDDSAFFNYSGSATVMLPAVNTCYPSLTGVMSVQLTDNVREINPRSAADMVTGTGCN